MSQMGQRELLSAAMRAAIEDHPAVKNREAGRRVALVLGTLAEIGAGAIAWDLLGWRGAVLVVTVILAIDAGVYRRVTELT